VRHGAPAGNSEQDLYFLGSEAFFFEESRIEIGVIPAEMVTAGGQNAAFGVALEQSPHGNVKCFSAHVLTDADELVLAQLHLDLLRISVKVALLNRGVSHGVGEKGEVEVSYVALVALKVRVVLEETVKLVAPRLPLQKNVLAVAFELLIYLNRNGVGQHPLAGPEFDVNELRSNELVLEGLLGDQLGLKVVVGGVLQRFLLVALDKAQPFFLPELLHKEFKDLLHHLLHHIISYLDEVGHFDGMLLHLLLGPVDVL
jgi:hypothetical protein